MPTFTGSNGANGTGGTSPTAGGKGQDQAYTYNGHIGADSMSIFVTGGDGGVGGTNSGAGAGASGGAGGNAAITLNGNIFQPMGSNLLVEGTSTGGNGGLGGGGGTPGTRGNGGNASVVFSGNIVQTTRLLSFIAFDAFAVAGDGARSGNAIATITGNIVQYNGTTATDVFLRAIASQAVPDLPSNTGQPGFGTKAATINGNIIQGNVNNLLLQADARYSNATATINGNIFNSRPTNTGFVTLAVTGQSVAITGNILNLGQQEVDIFLTQLGPTYKASFSGNIFNGTGTNTLVISDAFIPGPPGMFNNAYFNLASGVFIFNGQSNIINKFANVILSPDIQMGVAGTNGNDTLNGTPGNDVIYGLDGDDTINGLGGNDTLYGMNGNDTLTGGQGDDFLDGGADSDTAVYTGPHTQYTYTGITTAGGTVMDTVPGRDGTDTLVNVEFLKFSDGTYNVATGVFTPLAGNTPPVAVNDAYSTALSTPLTVAAAGVLTNDTDVDGDPLTAALVAGPAHGTLTLNPNGSFTYTPTIGFAGTDTFTYRDSDGTALSNTATVTITVGGNTPPVANNDTYTTNEDTPLTIAAAGVLTNDTDANADPLTAALVAGPLHGGLTLNPNGSFTYTPNANYNGSDSFTYRANDGTANSNIATVNITVNPVNDAPVAVNDTYTTNEDTPLTIAAAGVLTNDTDVDADPLTAALVAGPLHGGLTLNANGSFTYTPNANYNGSDSFTYRANDGTANSNIATVNITVNPVNDAPVAVNDAYSTALNTPLVILAPGVLGNDTDVDGDPLTSVLVTGPANGTLTLNANGSFTYTPGPGFNGTDSFTYRDSDGTALSNTATVNITVGTGNIAPVANNDAFSVNEDTPLTVAMPGVLLNDTDANGDPLTAVLVAGPAHGGLTLNPNGSFTYTPNANFNGSDSFTYQANDGTTNGNTATVNITVNPVNDAPVAVNDTYTTGEDTPLTIAAAGVLINDTDVDGDPLTAALVAGPLHGGLTLNPNGSFTYTPNANYNGADSFTYRANDGTANSNIATVNITVNPVNDAPVAVNDTYTTNEDTPLTIAAAGVLTNDTDVDGDPLTAALVAGPLHGGLTLNPNGSFTYTPNANYNGADSFTYRANDGTANSNIATVNITVNSVNDAPVAQNDSFSTNEDVQLIITPAGILSNDTDVDGDPLTAALVTGPANGTLTLNANGSFTYTPNANFNGADSFTYRANDGLANSNIATVNITVNPVNDAPVAVNDTYTTSEDSPLTIAAAGVLTNDTDVENDPLTAVLVAGPAHGGLTLNPNGSFTYTPNANYNGADSFTYRANDGTSNSNIATVNITVNPVNDAPVAVNDTYTTNEDTPLTIAAAGVLTNDTDVDGDPLTAALVAGPLHGGLTLNANGSFTYTPNANYNGSDSFTYRANDGTANSNTATVNITVNPVNDAPVAVNDSFTTNEDTTLTTAPVSVLLNDTDVEGDPLTAVLVAGPAHGGLTLNANGSFTYTPNANFNGTDSFTYQANDGTTNGNTATVNITVNPVNDAPVANNDAFTINEDTGLTVTAPGILGNDTDVDGDVLSVSAIVTGPAHGSLSQNPNGSFTYTPDANYNGSDSFTYQANDGTTNSNIATVNITINPVNDAPVANNDAFVTAEDTALVIAAPGILGNDTDVEGNPLTAVVVTGPAHGGLTANADGSFTYTPNANFNGSDSFTYQANDGTANSNIATVNITVTAVNDAPVAVNDTFTTNANTPLTILAPGVLGNDTDADGDTLSVGLIASAPAHGTLSLNGDGSFTYTPTANYSGADSFSYRAYDGTALSNIATVNLTVNPAVNNPPVANNDTATTNEDNAVTIAVLANDTDADGNPLTAALVTGPANGTLVLNPNNTFTYTPNANFNGTDSFTYRANDGTANSNNATVTITVNPVNDAPVAVNDAFTTNANTPLTILAPGVLGNDTDVDVGDTLSVGVITTGPAHGSLTLNGNGSFTYTPTANYSGADSFSYRAYDGTALSNIATVALTVNPVVNNPPVANNDTATTNEDNTVTIAVLANDTDADGNPLTAALVTGPANGTLVLNPNNTFTYTPFANFNGTDSFTYRANDGTANSNNATVTITVNPVNDAPVAVNDAFTTNANTPLTILAPGVLGNDTDVDVGDTLSVGVITTGPAHGSLTLNGNGSFTYTPTANYSGADSFSYRAYDGTTLSNIATVALTVNPTVNNPPVANNDTATTNEDNAVTIAVLANDTDADGNPLTAALVTGPANGTLVLNPNNTFTYTPFANFNGTDSFTYVASDGMANSNTATVNITVNPVNDAPVAVNDSFNASKNVALSITAPGILGNDTDVDVGDTLSVGVIATGPAHGSLSLNGNGSFTYTPNANYTGADSFTYRAYDGTALSNVATVNITVANDAPVANNDTAATNEDNAVTIAVLGNDTDANGDTLTVSGFTLPAAGTLVLNPDNTFTYTPFANVVGSDNFTYTVSDGSANSNTATVNIIINPVNDAPVAVNDTATTNEDAAVTIAVLANDTDVENDPLTVSGYTLPAGGNLVLNLDNTFTFTPDANVVGSSSFTYTATDGSGISNTATVTITINSVNDAPAGADNIVTTLEDNAFTFAASDFGLTDPNDSPANTLLAVTITTLPLAGSLTLNGNPVAAGASISLAQISAGQLQFSPSADANGAGYASFTFQVQDNGGTANGGVDLDQSPNTITINVTPVNDAPVAVNDSYNVDINTPLTITAPGVLGNDTDAENDPLTAAILTGPANGSLTFNADGSFTYTPNVNFFGTDNFSYRTNDGSANSGSATVNLTINDIGQTFNGTPGNDTLTGTVGNDTLNGGAGDDILIATKGADTLDGGTNAEGGDTADFRNATSGVAVDLGAAMPIDLTGSGLGPVTITNVENLNGSTFGDTLTGDAANNIFLGGLGSDTINGGGGTDTAAFHGLETQYGVIGLTAVTGGPDGTDFLSNIERLKFLSPSHVSDVDNLAGGDLLFEDDSSGEIQATVDGALFAFPLTFLGPNMKGIATGQFTADTDRRAGLLVQDTTNGDLSVVTDLIGVPVVNPVSVSPGATWTAITAGDFNGDAASDILLQDSVTGDARILFLNVNSGEAAGTVDADVTVTSPGAGYTVVSSGDFNGDGKSDILWQDAGSGATVVSLMSGGTVTSSGLLTPGANLQAIGTGDFNNDGMSDIMFQDTNTGNALIWAMNGTTPTGTTFSVAAPSANSVLVGATDVDNNGFSDLLWHDTVADSIIATTFDGGGVMATVTQQGPTGFRLIASTGGG